MGSPKEVYINAAPDGNARITLAKGVLVLNDLSTQTFETDDLEAFARFAEGERERGNPLAIFYDHTRLDLMPMGSVTAKTRPLAVCTLRQSDPLNLLKANLGKRLGLTELEKLLTALRRHGTFLTIISQLRTMVISKETKYERAVDNSANFKLLIERKGATGDWVPPPTLTFAVPVFAYMTDAITVEPDLIMTMPDEEGGAPIFELECLTFAEDLKNQQREILETRVGNASSVPTYWGKHVLAAETDAYLYKDNGATL